MGRAASLPCPSCEGLATRVMDTREDPEHPLGAVVWRIHQCLDCGAESASAMQRVSLQEARDRLDYLARERTMLARAGQRFTHPVGARS